MQRGELSKNENRVDIELRDLAADFAVLANIFKAMNESQGLMESYHLNNFDLMSRRSLLEILAKYNNAYAEWLKENFSTLPQVSSENSNEVSIELFENNLIEGVLVALNAKLFTLSEEINFFSFKSYLKQLFSSLMHLSSLFQPHSDAFFKNSYEKSFILLNNLLFDLDKNAAEQFSIIYEQLDRNYQDQRVRNNNFQIQFKLLLLEVLKITREKLILVSKNVEKRVLNHSNLPPTIIFTATKPRKSVRFTPETKTEDGNGPLNKPKQGK